MFEHYNRVRSDSYSISDSFLAGSTGSSVVRYDEKHLRVRFCLAIQVR
jgi:hypothetical protein